MAQGGSSSAGDELRVEERRVVVAIPWDEEETEGEERRVVVAIPWDEDLHGGQWTLFRVANEAEDSSC